jgi:hypothetical protein
MEALGVSGAQLKWFTDYLFYRPQLEIYDIIILFITVFLRAPLWATDVSDIQ